MRVGRPSKGPNASDRDDDGGLEPREDREHRSRRRTRARRLLGPGEDRAPGRASRRPGRHLPSPAPPGTRAAATARGPPPGAPRPRAASPAWLSSDSSAASRSSPKRVSVASTSCISDARPKTSRSPVNGWSAFLKRSLAGERASQARVSRAMPRSWKRRPALARSVASCTREWTTTRATKPTASSARPPHACGRRGAPRRCRRPGASGARGRDEPGGADGARATFERGQRLAVHAAPLLVRCPRLHAVLDTTRSRGAVRTRAPAWRASAPRGQKSDGERKARHGEPGRRAPRRLDETLLRRAGARRPGPRAGGRLTRTAISPSSACWRLRASRNIARRTITSKGSSVHERDPTSTLNVRPETSTP